MKTRLAAASTLLIILVALLALTLSPSAGAVPTSIEVGFLVDGSGSIAPPDFVIMKNGIAAAIENPNCVPQDGSLNLTVIQFSRSARVELNPVQITAANAGAVADTIRNMSEMMDATNYEAALNLAVTTMPLTSDYSAINITMDGLPTVTLRGTAATWALISPLSPAS
ncbi:MAG: vWA domain-containing protein [Chloroflexota bacterium]|nr:vWA domain-containing protein [Chloroflexota bacterium]